MFTRFFLLATTFRSAMHALSSLHNIVNIIVYSGHAHLQYAVCNAVGTPQEINIKLFELLNPYIFYVQFRN